MSYESWRTAYQNAEQAAQAAYAEVERLQRIIDSRPAMNAALPESYIEWSSGIYQLELARATGEAS